MAALSRVAQSEQAPMQEAGMSWATVREMTEEGTKRITRSYECNTYFLGKASP